MDRVTLDIQRDTQFLDALESELEGTTVSTTVSDKTSQELEQHHCDGHAPKRKDCPSCQLACGPVHRHLTTDPNEKERATRILHMDLSGPHTAAWPCESVYLVVGIARLQRISGGGLPLLPFVRCVPTKSSMEVSWAVDGIIGQIEALTIQDVVPGPRIVRLHTDKGTEYLGECMKHRLYERMIHHTTTLGYDPQANGLAERFVGIIKEQTRKLLQVA